MPEPSTAPLEQPLTGTPQPGQQAPVPPTGQPPVTQSPPNPAEPTADQIAQWRTQAEQAGQIQQQLQQREEQYRSLQGAYTRGQQALAALGQTPPPPPPDPLAPYVQKVMAQGYSEKEARTIASLNYEMIQQQVAPLQQELQQSRASVTNGFQVDQVMQRLYQTHQGLFANPAVYDHTRQAAMLYVMQPGAQLDPELLLDVAASASYRLGQNQQPPQNGQPPAVQPQNHQAQPFQGGMYGMRPGYQPQLPVQPQQRVLSPEAQKYEAELKSRFPDKKP